MHVLLPQIAPFPDFRANSHLLVGNLVGLLVGIIGINPLGVVTKLLGPFVGPLGRLRRSRRVVPLEGARVGIKLNSGSGATNLFSIFFSSSVLISLEFKNAGGLLDLGKNEGGSGSLVVFGLTVVDMRSLGLNLVGCGVDVVGVVLVVVAVVVVVERVVVGLGVVDLALPLTRTTGCLEPFLVGVLLEDGFLVVAVILIGFLTGFRVGILLFWVLCSSSGSITTGLDVVDAVVRSKMDGDLGASLTPVLEMSSIF